MLRISSLLLIGSLAANAALLVAVRLRPTLVPPEWQSVLGARRTDATPARAATGLKASGETRVPPSGAGNAGAGRGWSWADLQSDDLPALLARLKAAGFPPHVIRAVIVAKIDAHFAPRYEELYGVNEKRPYWKAQPVNFGPANDPKVFETMGQLYREYRRMTRELLGDEFSDYHADPTAEQRRRYGDLSPAKIARLQQIEDDYEEMMAQVRAASLGVTLPQDRKKLDLLEREKKADLAALLSPEEREEHAMRTSHTTGNMRVTMATMDATEEEFRAIFRLRQAQDERIRAMRPAEAMAARVDGGGDEPSPLSLQLAQAIKAALGEQRYAEYARASTHEYQQLARLAQREGLPAEAANRAFAVRDTVASESNRIFGDPALSLDEKRAALQTLARQSQAQILSLLGSNAGAAYLKQTRWLTTVERGSAVSFGPDNFVGTKALPRAAAEGAASKE